MIPARVSVRAEMDERYDFRTIEAKWQERWEQEKTFHALDNASQPKYYTLEMFPYPSGAGLSVGHVKNYAPTDAFVRYKSMRGFNVLHPMGWDAFGQPAENEAIKNNRRPREWTLHNIAEMKRQMRRLGLSYDWNREVTTCEPEYYRWNQWFFLKMYERGLAYRALAPVDWCPKDHTTLAREQVVGDERVCERCGTPVIKKNLEQWFLKITAYADELLDFSGIEW